MSTELEVTVTMNCQCCGEECPEHSLKTVKLSGFDCAIDACDKCLSKTAEASFKSAEDILNDIAKIVVSSKDPEKRLRAIRSLLIK